MAEFSIASEEPLSFDIAPPVVAPPVEEPPNPGVWWWLFGLFLALIILAVIGYLGEPTNLKFTEMAVQANMKMQAAERAQEEYALGKERAGQEAAIKIPPEVFASRRKDLLAAEITLALQNAERTPLDPVAAHLLSSSKEPPYKAFADIYSSKKLSPAEAGRLAGLLPEEPFVNVQARIDAYRKAGVKDPALKVLGSATAQRAVMADTFLMLALFAGTILWIVYFAVRASGKLKPLGLVAEPITRAFSERFAARSIQLLLVYIAASVLLVGLHQKRLVSETVADLLLSILLVAVLPALFLLPIGGKRITGRMTGWTGQHFGKNVVWGLAAACANAPVVIILAAIGSALFKWLPAEPHPIEVQLQNNANALTFVLIGIAAAVFGPIFEETLFRGSLLPALDKKFGSAVWAIVVSSLFFAGMHPTGPPQWLPLAGIGAVSCLLAYQTKSLIPSVVMHMTHNLVMLVIGLALS